METILGALASSEGDQQKMGLHPAPVGQQGLPDPKFGVLRIHSLRACSFRYDESTTKLKGEPDNSPFNNTPKAFPMVTY